jgi:hypothetical protein
LGATVHRKSNANEVLELLRLYPRKRLQLHVLEMALSIFRRLLGNSPEYLREINFCRATLNEILAALVKPQQTDQAVMGPGKMILPDGCNDLAAAADQFLAGLAAQDLIAFDQSLQKSIMRKFRGIGAVCLKPLEHGPAFRELLLRKSREFLDNKLDHSNPATVFFRSRTQAGTAEALLAEAIDEAAPDLIPLGVRPYELIVLGVPQDEDGNRLLALTRKTLPNVELTAAALPDDICFYREYPQVMLTDLPQLAGHARDAFLLMGSDHPPHTRTDIPWHPPS